MPFLKALYLNEELDPWNKLLRDLGDLFLSVLLWGFSVWFFCLFVFLNLKSNI